MSDLKNAVDPIVAVNTQVFLDAVDVIIGDERLDEFKKFLLDAGVSEFLVDSELANQLKRFLFKAGAHASNQTARAIIECSCNGGRGGGGGGGGAANVRGVMGRAAQIQGNQVSDFLGVTSAKCVLLAEEYYKGGLRITEQLQLVFEGTKNYFDVFIPYTPGRLSLNGGNLVSSLFVSDPKHTVTELSNPSSIDSFVEYKIHTKAIALRPSNFSFDEATAVTELRKHSISGIFGSLLGSGHRESGSYCVANLPITVRRLADEISFRPLFLGANSASGAPCVIDLAVLSKRPVGLKKELVGAKAIAADIVVLNDVEWWKTWFRIDLGPEAAAETFVFEPLEVTNYS